MSDIEKWIPGLESLRDHIYFGETIPVNEFVNLSGAVEFLKSRWPVKVQWLGDRPNCGYCGMSIDRKTLYCPQCGRAVKWDD